MPTAPPVTAVSDLSPAPGTEAVLSVIASRPPEQVRSATAKNLTIGTGGPAAAEALSR